MSEFQIEYLNLTNKFIKPFRNVKLSPSLIKKNMEHNLENKISIHLDNEKYELDTISLSSYSSSSLSDYIQSSSDISYDSSDYSNSSNSNYDNTDNENIDSEYSDSEYSDSEENETLSDFDEQLNNEENNMARKEWIEAINHKNTIQEMKIWSKKWHLLVTRDPHPFSPTFYELLDIDDKEYSFKDIKKKWRVLKEKTRNNENDSKTFLQIQEAYRVLNDDTLRRFYDCMLVANNSIMNETLNETETDENEI